MPPRLFLPALLFVVAACSKDATKDETKGDDPPKETPAETPASPEVPGNCGSAERPCTWGEVSEPTIARIQAVADLAIATLYDGKTPAQVADVLRAESDVSVLSATDDMIRYHVDGGRPAWVWLASSKQMPTLGGPVPPPLPLGFSPPALEDPEPPAGAQTEGKTPTKTALILSPFRWQWQLSTRWLKRFGRSPEERAMVFDDETEKLAEDFATIRDYVDGVTRKENALTGNTIDFGVTSEDFASWGDYDIVHVSTHGTSCAVGATDCEPAMATGELMRTSSRDLPFYNQLGVDIGFVPIGNEKTEADLFRAMTPQLRLEPNQKAGNGKAMDGSAGYTAGPFLLLTTTWFRNVYPDGLSDKIIFLSACSSGANERSLLESLAGPSTAVIGWDVPMKLSAAAKGADVFWATLLGYPHSDVLDRSGGPTIDAAMAKLESWYGQATAAFGPSKSIVIEGGVPTDPQTGARLRPEGDGTTRAREIISLVAGKKNEPLQNGALVDLIGSAGDGQPDKLRLEAEVIGIADGDDPGSYRIGVDVDGRTAAQTWTPTEKVEPGRWLGEAVVDLGFDLEPSKTFALEPWVDLPGGGRSRWRYEDIGVEYFTMTISGPQLEDQTFTIPPELTGFRGMGTLEDGGFLIQFQDKRARNAVSKDGTVLYTMFAGAEGPGIATRSIPFGRETGAGAWSLHFYLRADACPEDFTGCDYMNLRVLRGDLKIEQVALGKSLVRPNATGATMMVATFNATAVVTGRRPDEGDEYQIEGAFSLAE